MTALRARLGLGLVLAAAMAPLAFPPAQASLTPLPLGDVPSGIAKCSTCGDVFTCKALDCGTVIDAKFRAPIVHANLTLKVKFSKNTADLRRCKSVPKPRNGPGPTCPYNAKKCGYWTYHLGTCNGEPLGFPIGGVSYPTTPGYQSSCL